MTQIWPFRQCLALAAFLVAGSIDGNAATSCDIDIDNPIIIPANPKDRSDGQKRAYRMQDGSIAFLGSFAVDADGAPRAYGPRNTGLDITGNGGVPGDWWALATHAEDCGPSGQPLIQGQDDPAPGFFVSMTAMVNPAVRDCRKQRNYVDSATIPYVALPASIGTVRQNQGKIVAVAAINGGAPAFAGQADQAPRFGIGEGSIELARRLGLNPNPRNGGTKARELIFIVLNTRMGFPNSASDVDTAAAAAFAQWGGPDKLNSCIGSLLTAPR